MREIRGWNIGEVVTANEMTLNTANIYEETGSNGEANLPCIFNGLTLQSQAGTGNSIVTFNPGVARCQDLPLSTYTYLPANAYGTGYPCYIDISLLDSNTVITLTTSPTSGYIVATFTINPTTSGAVNYAITGSLLQIATGSYNPAIHVRLCAYTYAASTFTLDFTPGTHRDTDLTGIGGIQWNYQNSSLEINTPSSQTGTSIVVKQPLTSAGTTTLQNTTVLQGANALQFYNSGNTHYTSLQAGAVSSNVAFVLPTADATAANQFITSNLAGGLSFATPSASTANIQASRGIGQTYTSSSNTYQICNPTASFTDTMPAVLAVGVPWTFYNQATSWDKCITLQTSGSNYITIIPPQGWAVIVPLTSTPTTAAGWYVQNRQSQAVVYTPSGYGGFGSVTAVQAYAQLVNTTTCLINFLGQTGTTTASLGFIPIPSPLTISTTAVASVSTGSSLPVVGMLVPASTFSTVYALIASATSTSNIYFGAFCGASNANGQFSSGTPISGIWNVPVN